MNEADKNRLLALLNNDHAALDFCLNIAFVSEIFDDIYDGDLYKKSQLEDALATVLKLPSNTFYRQNFDYIQPLIDMAMVHWIASNKQNINLEHAHFFRYLGVQLWIAAIGINSGLKVATASAAEVWAMSTMETMKEFLNENAV